MNDLLPLIPEQLNQVLHGLNLFMPEIYLTALFIIVLITDLIFGSNSEKLCRIVACAGMVLVLFKDLEQFKLLVTGPRFIFSEMLLLHPTSVTFKVVIDVLSLILLLYMAWDNELEQHPKGLSDLYSIIIASVFGLHLMAMAVNLLSVYLAIEMVSIASYLLVSYRASKGISAEAGLKYVLFGAASSAIMLYGMSLLYGFGGSLNLFSGNLIPGLMQVNTLAVSFALVLVLVGIGFKLSFVPMHFWVPDVYEGAATPITAYLSTVTKVAAFALLVNFLTPFIFFNKWNAFDFRLFISVISIVTMIAGNFAAILQRNVKRMLAYSSIGHTGFALMAVVAFTAQGISALTFYILVYALANMGAFMAVSFYNNNARAEDLEAYKGLGLKYPFVSVCFVVLLISLAGLPVSAGFNGKLYAFSAVYAVYQHSHQFSLLLLLITGAATTVVSLFYYIKIPLNLFLRKSDKIISYSKTPTSLIAFIAIIALVMILLGLFPDFITKFL